MYLFVNVWLKKLQIENQFLAQKPEALPFFFFLLALRPSPSILHFLYRHSSELLLNLRSDPATCYLHPSLPDPLLHNSPRGQRFCYVSTQATDSRREIHKPCVGAEKKEKKKVCTSAYSSVKNGVICKVCTRGFLTVPCCFVSAAHAAGTGIPYCLPGHWPGSAGGGLPAPWHVPDSQLDP